jgi:hypothetical protein
MMRAIHRSMIFVGLCLLLRASTAGAADPCGTLPDTVRHLGEADPEQITEALHGCGRAAVPLLIQELKVIDPESDGGDWLHMVWCERALRSITGKYFEFRTTQRLGRVAEMRSKDDELGYVMERMSNGRIYLAPKDVQKKVIEAWKAWFAENGGEFEVARFTPYGKWFW